LSQNTKVFNFLVDGGKATAGPPIGPALGPLGLNVMQVVKRINELTADYAGMLATVINALALKEALLKQQVPAEVQSALPVEKLPGRLSVKRQLSL